MKHLDTTSPILAKIVFIYLILLSLSGFISSPIALALGFLFSFLFNNPFPDYTQKGIKQGLKIAVIGLGFGISLQEALAANSNGLGLLTASVILTVVVGIAFSAKLGLERRLGFLVTSGTAICGGSAIAAVSPVIKADSRAITIALALVFTLNSLALLIFPPLGKWLGLSQQQFGLWSAIAIHDTSSVVGAAMAYGDEALKTATTLKLSRTLWIIPLALFAAYWFKAKGQKIAIPYFIGGFILAMVVNSSEVLPNSITETIVLAAKHFLIVVLFLIGSTLSPETIKSVGLKPLFFAVSLWVMISIGSLLVIL